MITYQIEWLPNDKDAEPRTVYLDAQNKLEAAEQAQATTLRGVCKDRKTLGVKEDADVLTLVIQGGRLVVREFIEPPTKHEMKLGPLLG